MKKSRLFPILFSFFLVIALTFAAAEFQKKVQPVASGGTIKARPGIAYDAQAQKYLVVWQDRTGRSSGDWDIQARMLDSDGNPAGRVMHLASSAGDERHPRAAATGAGSWLVVWSTGRSIEACAVDAEGRIDGFRSVTANAGRPVDHPDIGFSSLDGRFFVVWEELDESGLNVIKGRSIGGPGEEARDAVVLGRSAYDNLQAPSINQAGGKFFVAWEKPVAAGRIDIEGREVPAGAASADALGSVVAVAADGARNTAPSVTGVPGTAGYFVVWQAQRGARRSEIAFADIGGDQVLLAGDLTATESRLESRPAAFAAGLAGRILVTYQAAGVEAPAARDIAARTIGWGDTAASAEIVLDEDRSGGGNPAIVRAAGADGRGIIVWDVREGEGTELFSRGWQEASTAAVVAANGPIVPLADITISGQVTFDGLGQADVLIGGLPSTVRTDALGFYAAMVPTGWTGTVTPVQPGFTFSPASRTYSNQAVDASAQDYVAAFAGGVDDAYEENDTFETAASLALGTTHDLVLGDEEWFKFYVPADDAGKDLKVRVWGTGFPDATTRRDLDFGILDASGRLLSYNLSGAPDETAYVCGVAEGWYYVVQNYVGAVGTVYSLSAELSDTFGLAYISGQVLDDEEESPVAGASVELYAMPFDWNVTRPMVFTDANGYYKIGWLPGDFTLRFNTQDFGDDGLAWTPDANYLGDVYQYNHVLTLTGGASLENVNMYLIPGGTITGQITDGSGAPLGGASAQVYLGNWSRVAAVLTDSSGVYRVDRLRAANYAVRARTGSGDLINEWFDDKALFASADPVGAAAAGTTSGIDASLDVKTWGAITGRVLDADMNPVGDLQVSIVDPVGLTLWTVRTDGDGYYTHSAVPAGDWKVLFNAASVGTISLVSQYYPGTRFLADATTAHVVAGAVTEGIDAVLPAAGSISGRILNNNGSVAVIAFDTASNFQWSVSPAVPLVGETTYILNNLPPGTYKVLARPSQQGDRIPHWYPDATSYAAAGTVTVAAGATTENIDVTLPGGGGMIIGRVVNAYGYAIHSVRVIAQDASKESAYSSAISDGDGYFTIRQVPPGSVKVYFNADANWLGYVSEYYNDKTSFAAADTITVNESESTPLSDAELANRPELAISTTSLAGGEIGVAYSQQLGVEGGWPLYRWTLYSGALPPGLAMSAGGAISGTPTTAGTFSFMVTVTDSSSGQMSATRELSITIGEYTGSGYMISGTVLSGQTPLAGVTMSGLPGNPATNADGTYIVPVPSGWSGTVTPVRSGNSFTPATRTYANVTADAAGQDYAAAAGYRIAGTVTRDGAGLAGVTMAGLPGAPTTDAAGAYAAAVPAGWSGTATPTLPGFSFTPADRTYDAIAADATAEDYAAAFAGGVDDAFEDNDSFETAAVLPMGRTSGLIIRDEDWFKFYVSAADAGKDIRVVLSGTAYPDPTIRQDMDFAILDADKRLLGYNTSGCDDETAYIYGAAEGWYYISNVYYEAPGVVYALTIDANADFGLAFVTGTLTDDGGNPIAGAYVELYGSPFDWNVSRPLVVTGEDGTYRTGYTPGLYTVQFNVSDFNDDLDWTPDVNFLGEAYHGGEVLTLVAGETLADIDGQLTPGGVISGRITDASGDPLGYAAAFAYAGDAVQAAGDVCDADGRYEIDRLRAGNYAVRFRAPGGYALATEWHSDATSFASAMPVAVAAGATTGGIDAALGTAGVIAGRITDGEGNPIESVQVTACDPAGMALQSASTDADGNYSLGRLPTGTFKIRFNAATVASANYISEYYPDVLGLNEAQEIAVTAGNSTSGIDGVLAEAGAISGTITDSGGQACVSANVYAFSPDGSFSLSATTDAAGAYAIRNLPPGDYRVRFRPSTENMTVEWYNDRADFTAADVVTVAAGATVSGLDAAFSSETGLITGLVTNGSGDPVEGLTVVAQDAAIPAACYSALTDASGAYTLRRLPTGSYKVWFNADAAYRNYLSEYYDDKGGHGSADAVEVTVGNTTSGIDAVLAERPALAVTTESLAAGELGVAYSGALAGSGGRPFYYW
ncbi:MAG: carboxypeptidase regulatory-like domain-containing protein, partial [Acidobacteriota bacterium]